jgi:Fe-S-cluster containining protein
VSGFSDFQCDQCGACCRTLIVEAYWHDAMREPRLLSVARCTMAELRSEERCIVLYDSQTLACPFLADNSCSIYPTRPLDCVCVEAGDAKCQQARSMAGLQMLCDASGQPPARCRLAESCEEYSLDLDEIVSAAKAGGGEES